MAKNTLKFSIVELLVLSLLSKKDLYGYEIVSLISRISNGVFSISEGTLYPTLYKMEDANFITYKEKLVNKRRKRNYYHLEEKGKQKLDEDLKEFRMMTSAIQEILNCDELPEQ